MKKVLLTALILLPLTVSCGKETTNNISYEKSTNSLTEKVTCNSDGSYTECTISNSAKRIIEIDARVNEDCLVNTDYYLLSDKILVTRNNCRATFTLEVE